MERRASKICATCGRSFAWRRGLARTWDDVRYCGERCRRSRRLDETDRALEASILALLGARGRGSTICPSEAARSALGSSWREGMERCRRAARRLVARGELEITQGGRVVDPSRARGAIRLRLPPNRLR